MNSEQFDVIRNIYGLTRLSGRTVRGFSYVQKLQNARGGPAKQHGIDRPKDVVIVFGLLFRSDSPESQGQREVVTSNHQPPHSRKKR